MALSIRDYTIIRVKSPVLWDKFVIDYILGEWDQLFKFTGKFRYLGMEDLPQKFLIENYSVNVEFLENKAGEITAGVYLISITEIANSVQQIWTDALCIVTNYILSLIDSIYLFDSQSKDENGNLSSSGRAVLLKFDTLHILENYIRSVYYNAYPMTLYFQLQFINIYSNANVKSTIECLLKKGLIVSIVSKVAEIFESPKKKIQKRKHRQ